MRAMTVEMARMGREGRGGDLLICLVKGLAVSEV